MALMIVTKPTGESVSDLEEVLRALERRFGKRVVYRLSQARPKFGEHAVSTGSLGLDLATGRGGVPRGRLATVDGPESSGKTTIGYEVVAAAQTDGGLAALIDAEAAVDAGELRACGVDLSDLILGQPRDAVEALGVAELLVRSAALDAIVVTVASRDLANRAEIVRRLSFALAGTPTALVLVGAIGGRGDSGRRNDGRATSSPIAAFASLSVRSRTIGLVTRSGGEVAGIRVRAEVVKNRLASPGGVAEFDAVEGRGVHREAELFDFGRLQGHLIETGLGWVYAGTLLGRNRERAVACLEGEAALAARLRAAILARPI